MPGRAGFFPAAEIKLDDTSVKQRPLRCASDFGHLYFGVDERSPMSRAFSATRERPRPYKPKVDCSGRSLELDDRKMSSTFVIGYDRLEAKVKSPDVVNG